MRTLLLLVCLFQVVLLKAQTTPIDQFICNWEPPATPNSAASTQNMSNGWMHTPRGNLHVLVLFVSFDDDFTNIVDEQFPNDVNALRYWAHNDLPNWAKGPSNSMFDKTPATIGQKKNLSNWFNVMSFGQFTVTGEVFPEMIRVPAALRDVTPYNFAQRNAWEQIRNNPLYDNFPWSNFDKRRNKLDNTDNTASSPDNKLDYVFIFFRVSVMLPNL